MKIRVSTKDGEEIFSGSESEFPLVIGRQAPAKIVIAANGVSGRHLEISVDGKKVLVRDLGSRNGTFICEERVNLKAVTLPCKIRLGVSVYVDLENEEVATQNKQESGSFKPDTLAVFSGSAETPHGSAKTSHRRPKVIAADSIWQLFAKLNLRVMAVLMIASVVPHGILKWLFGAEPFSHSLGSALGATFFGAGFSFLGAAVLAVPGWLIRGEYNFKPLFNCGLISMLFLLVHSDILLPLGMAESIGLAARLISAPILVFTCLLISYVFAFSTFPRYWGRSLAFGSLLIGFSFGLLIAKDVLSQDRQGAFKAIFTNSKTPSRIIAGGAVSPAEFADELKRLEAEMLAP